MSPPECAGCTAKRIDALLRRMEKVTARAENVASKNPLGQDAMKIATRADTIRAGIEHVRATLNAKGLLG